MTARPPPEYAVNSEPGQTALDPDEASGLLQGWVATRADLDLAEETNIASGKRWSERALRREVLTQEFLRELHRRLFGEVWKWAGRYRDKECNIGGVAPYAITTELHKLFADALAWDAFTSYPLDERAVRLHHRLVYIHPFPNGNGRCARHFTDLYLIQRGALPFTWGMHLPSYRESYLAALRAADGYDVVPLLTMVRQ
jgi:Fic-DOC domain mobile mystery protein B